ncbi:hypothetical protein L195_g005974 [Trifolium pratense]|uniref:Uncharacterized protein n=1 Tax=Trifolium pratense TaxID=57577 RepID=A0A2K3P2A7_TRIPR|nr:hypothetical protein L195_g005974 [Trifolium pratense]
MVQEGVLMYIMYYTKMGGIAFGKYMLLQRPNTYFGVYVKTVSLLGLGYKRDVFSVLWNVHFVIIMWRMIGTFYLTVMTVLKLELLLGWITNPSDFILTGRMGHMRAADEVILDICKNEDKDVAGQFAVLVWLFRSNRNNKVWNGEHEEGRGLGIKGHQLWTDWKIGQNCQQLGAQGKSSIIEGEAIALL